MSILHTYLKGAAERTYRRAMARVVVGLVGVGRLDNTKNVREVVEQIYFGSSDRNWIHDKGTRMIVYTLTSG